jgi:hypothetical protein
MLMGSLAAAPAAGADFAFQFVNDSERALSLKLFSRGGANREWPSKTKSWTVQPGTAVQELKVDCEEGEQICWGAWTSAQNPGAIGGSGQREIRTSKYLSGAGDRGLRACTDCCYVCKDGAKSPVAKLGAEGAAQ